MEFQYFRLNRAWFWVAIFVAGFALTGSLSAQEPGTIRGRVIDEEGRPVVSAMVVISTSGQTAVSDGGGKFVLTGVSPGSHRLEASCPGYSGEIVEGLVAAAGETLEIVFELEALPIKVREIVVTASASLLREEPAAAVALDRKQIAELPHFGDDLYRAVAVLPGVSGGDFSARFAIRGGLYDETLVILDGQEIMEPFHLKDLQGVFSIFDPEMIGGVELTPGGFTADHGDRMTGVLDMVTRSPQSTRIGLGISLTTAWANARGVFADGKGSWLASARRGYLDFILNASGANDGDDNPPNPKYWDAFGKLAFAPNPGNSLSLSLLFADDSLLWEEEDVDEMADVETGYTSSYLWLGHQGVVGSNTFVNTAVYLGDITIDRGFLVTEEPDERFALDDVRDDRFFGIRQEWQHDLGKRHYLRWGFDARSYDVKYDYELDAVIEDPIDDPRFYPGYRIDSFHDSYKGEQYAVFVSDRLRFGARFTGEIGVRYDKQTLSEDEQFSPRLNLLYKMSSRGVFRLGWGHFSQSQRPYELRVQYGETAFLPAQRAEQFSAGYETELGRGLNLKIDAYFRTVSDPHPRWETIFDSWHPLPEVATDLAEIAPESVNARGLEVYLADRSGGSFDWWVSYVYSSIEDEIDGIETPRYLNQPHSLTASASWRPGPKWSLTGVVKYHTGWPTTAVSAWLGQRPDGEWALAYDIGPFYQEFLDDYFRFDFRASRTSRLGEKGQLTFFIDIQNLSDRDNQRGIAIADPDYDYSAETGWIITFPRENWLPIIPSFGVSYEF